MHVERIWRYPVKSTGGELLDEVDADFRGMAGDRLYAVRDADGKFGSGKNTRRFRRMDGLLRLRSRCTDGVPVLLAPSGEPLADLRAYLGRDDVEVAREGEISHFDQLPLSVLTTATLDWVRAAVPGVPVDERRFRPNLLIRTPPGTPAFVEDSWLGRSARVGDRLVVEFVRSSERCVMTNEAQQDLPHSPLILRTIARPGRVRVGDRMTLLT